MAADNVMLHYADDSMYKVTVYCVMCSKKQPHFHVNIRDWERYRAGFGLIKTLFPDLSDTERELLMTGICGNCWDEVMGNDDE